MDNKTLLEDNTLSSVSGGFTSDGQNYSFVIGDCFKDYSWTYKIKNDYPKADRETMIEVDVFLYSKFYAQTKRPACEFDCYEYLGTNAF